MRKLIYKIVLTVMLMFIGTGPASAFDIINSQGIGLGQTYILSRPTATMLVNVPSGNLKNGQWLLESGYNRRYELSDLDQVFLASAYRYRKFTFSGGLTSFGKRDLYSELTAQLTAAYHLDSLTFSLKTSGRIVYLGGRYGRFSTQTFGLGIAYQRNRVLAAIVGDNLTTPQLYENAVEFNPVYSGYVEVIGLGEHSLTARITLEKYIKPRYGLAQKLFFSDKGSFFWGLSTRPMQYGGGVEINIGKMVLSYAISYHPDLSFSHVITLSFNSMLPSGKSSDGFK